MPVGVLPKEKVAKYLTSRGWHLCWHKGRNIRQVDTLPLLPFNHKHYSIRENKYILLFLLIPTFQKLGKITVAETPPSVTISSILENPQFARVSGCSRCYCDKFCDWWMCT